MREMHGYMDMKIKHEKGISLLETVVALAILSIISLAFLSGLASTSSARAIAEERVAAKLTCFVAEGDNFGTSSVKITGQQSGLSKNLSNPQSPVTDVWNGKSYPGTYQEGVDIDTFEVLWTDNILTPDDNVLHVDLYSYNDAWNLVYFIISVRSETVTGGTSYYVIYG
jgi:type II secretory pathway pseudopilin PulG